MSRTRHNDGKACRTHVLRRDYQIRPFDERDRAMAYEVRSLLPGLMKSLERPHPEVRRG